MTDKKNTLPVDPVEDARILQEQSRRDHADILGSYTGTAADGDAPEQDADDL